MNGVLIVNKAQDWTSSDVVAFLRKKLNIKKIGHLGTLDPMATGVLPVTVNKATKLFDLFLDKRKTYVAEFEFGYETDTLDATGTVMCKNDVTVSREQLEAVLSTMIGKISQMPPKYSAKKVNGKRAYDLARSGVAFELKPKIIEIFDICILKNIGNRYTVKIECSSGTYIRAIGRDLAYKLNTFATMLSLERTRVGVFDISEAKTVDDIDMSDIISLEKCLTMYDNVVLNHSDYMKIINGQKFYIDKKDGIYNIYDGEKHVGLIKITEKFAKMYLNLV